MSAPREAMRAATAAAVAGLAWLTLGAGPGAPIPAAQSPVSAPVDDGAGPVPIRQERGVTR